MPTRKKSAPSFKTGCNRELPDLEEALLKLSAALGRASFAGQTEIRVIARLATGLDKKTWQLLRARHGLQDWMLISLRPEAAQALDQAWNQDKGGLHGEEGRHALSAMVLAEEKRFLFTNLE